MLSRDAIEKAKQVDLLALIGTDTCLRKVASTNGGEYAGPCPFCGGRDRFRVQPKRGRWWCRQCSGEHWHDAIDYVPKRDNVDFEEACRRLGAVEVSTGKKRKMTNQSIHEPNKKNTPPSEQWQSRAREWIAECENVLWSAQGVKARAYLHEQRGLSDEVIRHWHLGYNANDRYEDPRRWGLNGKRMALPRGIIIPCQIANKIWYMKIRFPQSDPKYLSVRGSAPALFGAETLGHHDYAILTEGEFDAMLTRQCLQRSTNPDAHRIGVATLGSATNSLDVDSWAHYLLPVSRFLVCYDADKSGQRGSEKWQALSNRARPVTISTRTPGVKDLTDYHLSGGSIPDLITFEIARDQWLREQAARSGEVAQAAQVAQAAHPAHESTAHELDLLRTQQDMTLAKWNRLLDEMDKLDQESSEFNCIFTGWQKLDVVYRELCDRITVLEAESVRCRGSSVGERTSEHRTP